MCIYTYFYVEEYRERERERWMAVCLPLSPSLSLFICVRLQASLVPSVQVWSQALEDHTLTMLTRSLASTSIPTPHARSLQCLARPADPDCSLEQCSQPLNVSFETRVN